MATQYQTENLFMQFQFKWNLRWLNNPLLEEVILRLRHVPQTAAYDLEVLYLCVLNFEHINILYCIYKAA